MVLSSPPAESNNNGKCSNGILETGTTNENSNETTQGKIDDVSTADDNEKTGNDETIVNNNNHNNDFVIRDGFPALRLPGNVGWNIHDEEPIPNGSFWVVPDLLKIQQQQQNEPNSTASSLWETLWYDAATVFTSRTRDNNAAYSVGTTYFCPSLMKPRCALEALALMIFQKHTKHIPPGIILPEQSGAEWWTLVLDDDNDEKVDGSDKVNNHDEEDDDDDDDDDDVGMHFDADYGLEEQVPNLTLHPRLATVTYLTSVGAPTLVLDLQSPPPADTYKKSLNGSVRRGWLSHPIQGKHIAFDGRLLHGAPSSFFPPASNNMNSSHSQNTDTADNGRSNEDTEPPAKKAKRLTTVDEEEAELFAESTKKKKEGENPRFDQKRITLLVNIWINHCPLDAEPLEDEIIDQLKTPWMKHDLKQQNGGNVDDEKNTQSQNQLVPYFSWEKDDWNTSETVDIPKVSINAAQSTSSLYDPPDDVNEDEDMEPAGEEEVVIGGRLVTISYGATMHDFHNVSQIAATPSKLHTHNYLGCIELELGREVIALTVGDPVEEEEQDSDSDS